MSGGNTAKSQAIRDKVRQFEAQGRHGWCKPEKADILIDLVAELQPVLAVEIGVYGGASLIPIALAMREYECGRVIGIDPWRTEDCLKNMTRPENRKWWSSLNLEEIMASCQSFIKAFGVGGITTLLRTTSEKAVDSFSDGSIGLLHIDGNHSRECSMKDAMLYLPKVKVGGAIVFDDVLWHEAEGPTQMDACQFLIDCGCEKVRECDNGNCWIFLKTRKESYGSKSEHRPEGLPAQGG